LASSGALFSPFPPEGLGCEKQTERTWKLSLFSMAQTQKKSRLNYYGEKIGQEYQVLALSQVGTGFERMNGNFAKVKINPLNLFF